MIKLIAIDLDGSLLDDQKNLSAENRAALHYANEKGIQVILCTGRPYKAALPVLNQVGIKGPKDYLVCFNGGQIYRAQDGQLVEETILSMDDFNVWLKESQRLELPLTIIDSEWVYEDPTLVSRYPSIYVTDLTTAPSKVINYSNLNQDHGFIKFVMATDESFLQKQISKIHKDLFQVYNIVQSHPYLLEIVRKGVSKGAALAKLGQILNIDPEEMMAIGDQGNDLSMIQLAGLGVAMGNAPEAIKAQADFVTIDNNQSGVAHAIYKFIK